MPTQRYVRRRIVIPYYNTAEQFGYVLMNVDASASKLWRCWSRLLHQIHWLVCISIDGVNTACAGHQGNAVTSCTPQHPPKVSNPSRIFAVLLSWWSTLMDNYLSKLWSKLGKSFYVASIKFFAGKSANIDGRWWKCTVVHQRWPTF